MNTLTAIILAAGKGTRMKSSLLKVAHKVGGIEIINHVLNTVRDLGVKNPYLVVGHQAEIVQDITKDYQPYFVEQKEQLGTGHAVMQAVPELKKNLKKTETNTVIILAGDCPLISLETLEKLHKTHQDSNAAGTILSVEMTEPVAYGRLLRNEKAEVLGIREAKDCTDEQLKIKEINSGVYCFNCAELLSALEKLSTDNAQGEYYLTDVFEILKEEGKEIAAYCSKNSEEAIGVNTREDLAKINESLYEKTRKKLMLSGVSIMDPKSTFIDSSVTIKEDTIIHPFTIIEGKTVIGKNCQIGPHCYLSNTEIADNETLSPFSSHVD